MKIEWNLQVFQLFFISISQYLVDNNTQIIHTLNLLSTVKVKPEINVFYYKKNKPNSAKQNLIEEEKSYVNGFWHKFPASKIVI